MASPRNDMREQDQYMPISKVIRIMRCILPSDAKISDDAKETIQECVSKYISFITAEANVKCQHEQRRTVTAEDVLFAMRKLGFEDYVGPLSLYLQRYRESEGKPIAVSRVANYNYSLPPPQPPAALSYGSAFPPNVGMFDPSTATSSMFYKDGGSASGSGNSVAVSRVANYNYSLPPPQPPVALSYGSAFPPNVGMFVPSTAISSMFYRDGGSTSGSGNSVDAFDPFAHNKRT